MITVNTHEAKTKLSELLNKIQKKHEKIIICRNGKPIAEMHEIRKVKNPLKQHPVLKKVVINENPALPLNEDEWPSENR